MESIVKWFTEYLSPYVSPEIVVFIISLFPILEVRGGLVAARLLQIPETTAVPLCVLGNVLPIPFILLFIKQIFKWMKKTKVFRPMILWLEKKAMGKSTQIEKYGFWGLVLFVGVPLPGTGAWTGALIASLLGMEIKKSSVAILIGVVMATVIMYIVSYLLMGNIIS